MLQIAGISSEQCEDEDPSGYVNNLEATEDLKDEASENIEDEATLAAKRKELDKLKLFKVAEDVPAHQAVGKKWISTRWEIDHRVGEVRARFVAREFKRCEWREDLFAPSSSQLTSKLIDWLALRWGSSDADGGRDQRLLPCRGG